VDEVDAERDCVVQEQEQEQEQEQVAGVKNSAALTVTLSGMIERERNAPLFCFHPAQRDLSTRLMRLLSRHDGHHSLIPSPPLSVSMDAYNRHLISHSCLTTSNWIMPVHTPQF
jgi:hypothetical protein